MPTTPMAIGPTYKPNNVYSIYPVLPHEIRRLAVLPISVEPDDWEAIEGRNQLQPVLHAELGKVKKFELMAISPEQLRELTGRDHWRSDELLPPDLLKQVKQKLGCDAILFAHLRPYRAYKPLIVGWNLRMVHCPSGLIFWSADEVFDSSESKVARGALHYCQQHGEPWWSAQSDPLSILGSPRRFSQYTLSLLFTMLPER